MITIPKEILSAEPVKPGSSIYKITNLDNSFSALQVFPKLLTTSEKELFSQKVVAFEQAVADYGAALPFVMGSGYTIREHYPYLETEWIEGETLHTRMERGASSSEALRVAEQVSRILTISHKLGLPHGNLNSSNILWDTNRNRFVLTGFNLLEEAGKEELARKDIKDLGTLLIQIEKQYSLQYPAWFTAALNRTTRDEEVNSYPHMGDFYMVVLKNHKDEGVEKRYRSKPQQAAGVLAVQEVSKPVVVENKRIVEKQKPIEKQKAVEKKKIIPPTKHQSSKSTFFTLNRVIAGGFILSLLLLGLYLYSEDKVKEPKPIAINTEQVEEPFQNDDEIVLPKEAVKEEEDIKKTEAPKVTKPVTPITVKRDEPVIPKPEIPRPKEEVSVVSTEVPKEPEVSREAKEGKDLGVYKVRSKAYFHNKPDPSTRRNAFIVHWNNAKLKPLDESGDFVYIVFTNVEGQTTKGWLAKKDLVPVE